MSQAATKPLRLGEIDKDITDLKARERFVLFVVATNNDVSPAEIEAVTGFHRTYVRDQLTELKRRGWVEARPDISDPRAHHYEAILEASDND